MDFDPTVVRVAFSHLRSWQGQVGTFVHRAARRNDLDDSCNGLLEIFSRFGRFPARRGRFATVVNNLRQFALADHCSAADLCALQPALGKPSVNSPLADAAKTLCGL
jgi:hypothetical protein